ncbi:chaperone DNAJ protein, putative [Trypanosoma cruzi marinkellei]|uniref:Chaperone DNAJ protein, putative n=1 Tax=Trypanosoma cruzi marinkellei TaxID=85056 RepID=K2MVR1_TRYCR|nr:chaperone DNAJ protein, putative [Trypanosoma cruzi marinkellei]
MCGALNDAKYRVKISLVSFYGVFFFFFSFCLFVLLCLNLFGPLKKMDNAISPYDVLGVSTSSSVAEIRAAFKRLALCTHPDKRKNGSTNEEELGATLAMYPFHVVKEASELLLDPLRRAQYDHGREQAYVRSVGAVSDTHDLSEFFLAEEKVVYDTTMQIGGFLRMRVYKLECRCGGVFELFITEREAETQGVNKRCECDCCSLVILVTSGRALFI